MSDFQERQMSFALTSFKPGTLRVCRPNFFSKHHRPTGELTSRGTPYTYSMPRWKEIVWDKFYRHYAKLKFNHRLGW